MTAFDDPSPATPAPHADDEPEPHSLPERHASRPIGLMSEHPYGGATLLLALVAGVALAVWIYPEFRRYMHIRRM